MRYTCPNGHEVEAGEHEAPRCERCNIISTWCNAATGEVYTWRTIAQDRRGRERLQAMMDDAFCNQYFQDW